MHGGLALNLATPAAWQPESQWQAQVPQYATAADALLSGADSWQSETDSWQQAAPTWQPEAATWQQQPAPAWQSETDAWQKGATTWQPEAAHWQPPARSSPAKGSWAITPASPAKGSWAPSGSPAQGSLAALTAAPQASASNALQLYLSALQQTALAEQSEDMSQSEAMMMGTQTNPFAKDGEFTGSVLSIKEKFGFIKQDHDEENMFVMPNACEQFGNEIPPPGTLVSYDVVVDAKTGKPRAENVAPPPPSGTILSVKESKFGFIRQDFDEENMFVMPNGCSAFGGIIPDVGTRVRYGIVTDAKTGRIRAENVRPEPHAPIRLQASAFGGKAAVPCGKGAPLMIKGMAPTGKGAPLMLKGMAPAGKGMTQSLAKGAGKGFGAGKFGMPY